MDTSHARIRASSPPILVHTALIAGDTLMIHSGTHTGTQAYYSSIGGESIHKEKLPAKVFAMTSKGKGDD